MKRVMVAAMVAGMLGILAGGCSSDDGGSTTRGDAGPERRPELDSRAKPMREGWIALFDGQSLRGWTQRGGKAEYRVEDGAIVGKTVPKTPNSFLCTDGMYGDFELELEFKVDDALNSGVQIRSETRPDGKVRGYQVEIDPSERSWTGGLYEEGGRGWLANLEANARGRGALRRGAWNTMRVSAVGDTFSTWINEVPVVQGFKDERTKSGFIALQVHDVGDRAAPLEVRWRKIEIRAVKG